MVVHHRERDGLLLKSCLAISSKPRNTPVSTALRSVSPLGTRIRISRSLETIRKLIAARLLGNEVFRLAVRPKALSALLFSCYEKSMHYGLSDLTLAVSQGRHPRGILAGLVEFLYLG